MSGPRLLSESVPKVTGKVFSRKHIMLGRLVTRWADIVGTDLADKTQPVQIRRIGKGKDGKAGISLDIAATTAEATVLHYRKDLILERINQIFGERLVTAIRFVPVAANTNPGVQKRRRILSPVEDRLISEMTEGVADMEIQERLRRLGRAMLLKNR